MTKSSIFTFIILILSILSPSEARAERFFELPIVPDTMAFNNRVNYLVTHYWDFCDLKKAFSSKQRIADAFKEYLDLMPLADGDVAIASVDKFIKSISKQPENLLFITREAEEYMYSDTAVVISDVLYLPFIKAVASSRKISDADKMRYERQARLISNCMIGSIAPDFSYIDRSGQKCSFATDTAEVVILYIFDTECSDCQLNKVRLDADASTTKLIDAGKLKIVAIDPTTPDGEWRDRVADYPTAWAVGANEALDEIYEYRQVPTFFLMDGKHRIYAKHLNIDQVLDVNRQLALRTPDPYIKSYRAKQTTTTETPGNK